MHEARNGNTPAAVAARQILQKMAEKMPDLKKVSHDAALTLALEAECHQMLQPAVATHLSFECLRLDISNDWARPRALFEFQSELQKIARC